MKRTLERLKKYFAQYTRADIEILFYFFVAFVMVFLLPAILFFDYTKTLEFSLWWYRVTTIIQITVEDFFRWIKSLVGVNG